MTSNTTVIQHSKEEQTIKDLSQPFLQIFILTFNPDGEDLQKENPHKAQKKGKQTAIILWKHAVIIFDYP